MSGEDTTVRKTADRLVSAPRRRAARVVRSPDPSVVGRVLELDRAWLLGRRDTCSAVIDDSAMSREHLRLIPDQSGYGALVEDLRTMNGTFLNGQKLEQATLLANGDVIAAGDTILVIDVEPEPEARLSMPDSKDIPELVGVSFAAEELRSRVMIAARATGSVLILGPTGSGKEIVAQAIHRIGAAPNTPLVARNCANLAGNLARSELYGYKKGAYSGAEQDTDGWFKLASGGTLFLDEIGDLPREVQAMLLRTLETKEIEPVGGRNVEHVETRAIFATLVDLEATNFRPDLRARMEWTIKVPSLSARRADILLLFRHFLTRFASPLAAVPSSAEFDEALLLHPWPEHVREVRNLAKRLAEGAGREDQLELDHLPIAMQRRILARYHEGGVEDPEEPIEDDFAVPRAPSRAALISLMARVGGNVTKAAAEVGAHRTQMNRWLKRAGIDRRDYASKDGSGSEE